MPKVALVIAGLLLAVWVAVGFAQGREAAVMPGLGISILVCFVLAMSALTLRRTGRRRWAWLAEICCVLMPAGLLAVQFADRTATGHALLLAIANAIVP